MQMMDPVNPMISLLKESGMLQDITDQFAPSMKRFSIFYFWEEVQTQNGASRALVVDPGSAAPPWHDTERCGIAATHSGMVKSSSSSDSAYEVLFGALVRGASSDSGAMARGFAHACNRTSE